MISIAITVCNEHKELETLLDYLSERALSPDYEIVIQIDEKNHTPEVLHVILNKGIKHHFFPLNKDFAAYKNELIKHCSGEYIFQIDADELPNVDLLKQMCERTDMPVIASGGIATLDDLIELRALTDIGVEGAIVGKALYARAFTLEEAIEVSGPQV